MITERQLIRRAVDEFAGQMFRRMMDGVRKGKSGWNDPANPYWVPSPEVDICNRLDSMSGNHFKNDEVDAANYLMMLRRFRQEKKPTATTDAEALHRVLNPYPIPRSPRR